MFILDFSQINTLELGNHLVGYHLVASLVVMKGHLRAFGLEIGINTRLGQQVGGRLARVGVVALDSHIVDLGAHTQGCVAGQSPGSRRPCDDFKIFKPRIDLAQDFLDHLVSGLFHLELSGNRLVFHLAVAARLVQLVRTQAGTGSGRIGLNSVALIEQPLVVELLEQPPQGFDVTVLVGNIGVVHIDPIAHLVREVFPFLGVFHHLLAAGGIVFINSNLLAYVLLGNAQSLLHAQLHRQSMRVPASLAQHLIALHGLKTADDVLQ